MSNVILCHDYDSDDPSEDPVCFIHDLAPATSYEVAIAASNVIGNSSYSQLVVMATHEIGDGVLY